MAEPVVAGHRNMAADNVRSSLERQFIEHHPVPASSPAATPVPLQRRIAAKIAYSYRPDGSRKPTASVR
jgi:hypothetical protein